eukprot:TRINITY_DN404_c0_g1_i13.p1 TRINITY_DN404_c0_g1~~TRINITY_DN404_c0_g1_i13.p1  ORF type:complete len:187 (-),score=54.28 TRINITY_DN404_c0_g1_i13:193-753(-)
MSSSDMMLFSPPHLSPKSRVKFGGKKCAENKESIETHYNTILEEFGEQLETHARPQRSASVLDRLKKSRHTGTIVYFCRSRGHGFIRPDPKEVEQGEILPQDIFMHISDIDSDFAPQHGDSVTFQLQPMPPKFDKAQAAHVRVVDMTASPHKFWSTPQSKEEIQKEQKMGRLEGSPTRTTPAAAEP